MTLQQRLQPRRARIAELEEQIKLYEVFHTDLEQAHQKQVDRVSAANKEMTAQLSDYESSHAELAQTQRAMEDVVELLSDALQQTYIPGLSLTPEKAAQELREQGVDSGLISLLVDNIGWDRIGALTDVRRDDDRERALTIEVAERLFKFSPLAQWAVWLWTGWGLGDKVTVTLKDEDAQAWWDEFVGAERNEPIISQDVIHELSDWVLVKGNRYIVFFAATGGDNAGRVTARVLDQAEITPVPNPQDKLESWFYKRTFHVGNDDKTLYYPDFRTFLAGGADARWAELQELKVIPKDAERADEVRQNGDIPGTVAAVMHIAFNRKNENSVWGWPLFTASAAWLKGHKQFAESRLGVAVAVAQFVRRTQVKGGSRAVSSVISQVASTLSRNNLLDTNPPGAAGSWAVENEASKTKELPMRTGAGDAHDDNELFAWMANLGNGLFPVSAGLDTARYATAVEMDKAQSLVFERYQRFWASQFQKMARIVLLFGQQYGAQSFKDTKAQVSSDTFSLADFPAVTESIAKMVDSMLTPYVNNGVISTETAQWLLHQLWLLEFGALNVGTAGELSKQLIASGDGGNDGNGDQPPAEFEEVVKLAARRFAEGEITAEQMVEFLRVEE